MTLPCLLARADCWPLDPPSASIVVLMLAVFFTSIVFVVGAALPGKTATFLSKHERWKPGRAIGAILAYAAWLSLNLAIGWWLWTQLFPSAAPERLVYDVRPQSVARPCSQPPLVDVRCLLGSPQLAIHGAVDADRVALATLDAVRTRRASDGEPPSGLVAADVAVYAALLTAPVSDVVFVGASGVNPASIEELGTHGWPWVARWITSRKHRGFDIREDFGAVASELDVEACERKPRAPSIPARAVLIRFCMTEASTNEIEAITAVTRVGDDILVQIRGRALPDHAHASIDDVPFAGSVERDRFGDRGTLRLAGAAPSIHQGKVVRVGSAPDRLTLTKQLDISTALPWCLVVEGRSGTQVEDQRRRVMAGMASNVQRDSLAAIKISETLCKNGSFFVAANGTIVAGFDLERPQTQAMAIALTPNRHDRAFRARVLDATFDVSPGLLDDVRFGQTALDTRSVVASPVVVREAAFNAAPQWPDDPGRGYADFAPGRLVDSALPLAAIVAWIEPATPGLGIGRVLAGSFGQSLWSSDSSLAEGSWGGLIAMREAFELPFEVAFRPHQSFGDAVGISIEHAVDAQRQRGIFAALAAWLLLMFAVRLGGSLWMR